MAALRFGEVKHFVCAPQARDRPLDATPMQFDGRTSGFAQRVRACVSSTHRASLCHCCHERFIVELRLDIT